MILLISIFLLKTLRNGIFQKNITLLSQSSYYYYQFSWIQYRSIQIIDKIEIINLSSTSLRLIFDLLCLGPEYYLLLSVDKKNIAFEIIKNIENNIRNFSAPVRKGIRSYIVPILNQYIFNFYSPFSPNKAVTWLCVRKFIKFAIFWDSTWTYYHESR